MDTLGTWVQVDSAKAGQKLRNSTLLSYPAIAWYHYVKPSLSFNWNGLGNSEATGEANLTALIKSDRAQATAAGCPNAPILIAGYSQGAEVVVRTIDALSRAVRNTISVALLGNPSFTANAPGDLDLNKYAYYGIRPSFLAGQRYTLKSDVISRTIDLCAASDPICAYHLSLVPALFPPLDSSAHYHYVTLTYKGLTLVNYAANYLWAHRAVWTATEAPLPADARSNTGETLSAVSCPSVSQCVAVGTYSPTSGGGGLLLTGSGRSWTGAQAPLPANAYNGAGDGVLSGVSCPSVSQCVAVGEYYDTAGIEQGLVVTGSGGAWTAIEAPLPANASANGMSQALLSGVSCPSVSQCVAVGEYYDTAGSQQGLLLTDSGGSWTAAEAPLPEIAPGEGWLSGVSCPSVAQCVAVGEYNGDGVGVETMVLTDSGGSWTAALAPVPPNSAGENTVSAVSCPSVLQCVAVGHYGPSTDGQMGLLLTDSGGSWTAGEAPLAANGANGGEGAVPGVSCGALSQCVAVGRYYDKSGSGFEQGLLLTDSGGSWTAAEAPLPANALKAFSRYTQASVNAVSCPPAAQCVAVGTYDATSGSGGLLLTQAGP